tara:strand:- start:1802 stop:2002 length:201 start_codon:yes stop_codon:yes gene_type:complete
MMEKEKEIIKWSNMSNSKITHELKSIKEYHTSLKTQISKLLDKIDELEKEYLLGTTILEKRKKGIS